MAWIRRVLRLVIGFITGHCEIRSLTRIWIRWDEEELETNCPALNRLRLKTLPKGFFESLNSVPRAGIKGRHRFIIRLSWLRSTRDSLVQSSSLMFLFACVFTPLPYSPFPTSCPFSLSSLLSSPLKYVCTMGQFDHRVLYLISTRRLT